MALIKAAETSHYTAFSLLDIEQEAVAVVDEARRQAAEIVEAARADAVQMHRESYAAGLQEGRAAGNAEGLALGLEEGMQKAHEEHGRRLGELADAIEAILGAFDRERELLAARAAGEVAQLAVAIADRVCKRAAELRPEVARANATAALRLVMRSHDVRLHVNAADHGGVESLLPDIGRKWPALAHVRLVSDPSVARGGCLVRTEGGIVDADLRTQLDRIAADLVPEMAGDQR